MADFVSVRAATEEDTEQILAVLRSALGETPLLRRTPELFAWKHHNNPFGKSIVLVAEKAGRLAGVRALMRWELTTPQGDTIFCARPVDTATHPDFVRKGVFRTLTLSALDVARDSGIDLIFNTPNPRSAQGYLSMGWKEVGWTGAIVKPRLGRATAVKEDRVPLLAEALPGAKPFQPMADADRSPLGLRTPRSEKYLSWRFTAHPTARYGWVEDPDGGGAVVRASQRKGRTETVVADLLAAGGSRCLRRISRNSRSRLLVAWFSPGTPERQAARSVGMFAAPGLKTLRLLANPLTEIDIDVFELRSWDLAVSDLELL